MKNGIEKIERNTEYTIMLHGKWEKFAFYSLKDNGRLCLLNTRYGTLTSMNASYFLKLISGKYPCSKRPYKVEYPEDVLIHDSDNTMSQPAIVHEKNKDENLVSEDRSTIELKKWAFRLKTLPLDVEETLEKDMGVAPKELGEKLEKWVKNEYQGSVLELIGQYNRVKELLKGTEWYVK